MSKRDKLRESRATIEGLRRRLQRSEVELFAAGVAHEFNNVLGAALGHAEWALDSKSPADMQEALELVIKACERAREITWALKGLAQPREERISAFALADLVQEISTWAQTFLATDNIVFVNADSVVANLEGDFAELKEILINLVSNARDSLVQNGAAMSGPPLQIELKVFRVGNDVHFEISDNGRGVPIEFRDAIFRPFFTTKGALAHVVVASASSASPKGGGMGLGLYLARNAAIEHGGDLFLKPGAANVFVLQLPLQSD